MSDEEYIEHQRALKAERIMQHCAESAKQAIKLAKIAYPRRLPRILKRNAINNKLKRYKMHEARAKLVVHGYMSCMQLQMILAQPIPKHNFELGATAIVEERGPELIEAQGVLKHVVSKISDKYKESESRNSANTEGIIPDAE